jgi:hypothetical protein
MSGQASRLGGSPGDQLDETDDDMWVKALAFLFGASLAAALAGVVGFFLE